MIVSIIWLIASIVLTIVYNFLSKKALQCGSERFYTYNGLRLGFGVSTLVALQTLVILVFK